MINNKILILIVTFNGSDYINACIQSVINENFDVLIVDNNSTDNTCEIIKNQFPNVTLLEEDSNHGFGYANNIGLKYGLKLGYRFFFLLNQDTLVGPGCLNSIFHNVGLSITNLVSPVHLNIDGNGFDHGFKSYVSRYFDYDDFSKNNLKAIVDCDFINAAAWLLSDVVIKKVGLFDPLYNHYGEDRDYFNRLKYFKIQTKVLTDATIRHLRTEKKLSVSQKLQKLRIFLLVILKDINSIFLIQIIKSFKIVVQEILNSIFRDFSLSYLGGLFKTSFLLLREYPTILNSRSQSKEGNSYINFIKDV